MREQSIKNFIDSFLEESLTKKYLQKNTWLSGSSTYVSPITIWRKEIVFQWGSDKNIFNKFIKRIVEENKSIIEGGYFSKSDGSCPSTITFLIKEVTK